MGRAWGALTSFSSIFCVSLILLAYERQRHTLRGVQDIFTHISISTQRNFGGLQEREKTNEADKLRGHGCS